LKNFINLNNYNVIVDEICEYIFAGSLPLKQLSIELLIKVGNIDPVLKNIIKKRLFYIFNIFSPHLNTIFLNLLPLIEINLDLLEDKA